MNDELPTASEDLRRATSVAQEMASAVRLNSLGAPTHGDHLLKLLVSLIGHDLKLRPTHWHWRPQPAPCYRWHSHL
ncbi:hypothetical protein DBIPINDM_001587 [Mesorhizobium sp. AR02]|uniref:hypothetical protein n=1 Tax=Mesorhizobium sp. AR02 TaxID=2865837 RepID=UPI0021605615|nr:hypothetical protein [Mesorhizobium sp. AR02]UVK55097.1 hypothetical protein DBIPINDM_001587 [Mesorhizobium sp. AR02]